MMEANRPWEEPGAVRRDAEPDRGLLGLVALVLGLAPVCGVVLGAVVLCLANSNIRKMRAGRMHRGGMWEAVFGGLLLWRFLFGP